MSLALRITIGVTLFLVWAALDLWQNGRRATRWREYLFLLTVTLAAMIYGALNDQITSRISWEYFYYGKQLEFILGPTIPPDPHALHWQAMKVGITATWSVGLLMGVALLVANNPSPRFPRLPETRLLGALPIILVITAISAILGGLAGFHGWLDWMSADFLLMDQSDIFRPRHFLCTYGVHLGGYIGGAIGTIAAIIWVRKRRAVLLRDQSRSNSSGVIPA